MPSRKEGTMKDKRIIWFEPEFNSAVSPKRWTSELLTKLRDMYPHFLNREIAAKLGRSVSSISRQGRKMKLRKSSETMTRIHKQAGQCNGAFKSGHEPWNLGKKGIQTGGISTRFKPGQESHNAKSDGTVTLRFDREKYGSRPWLAYRIAERKWIPYSRYVFAQYYGEVPPGMVIRHKNGNRLDCRIENLECITKYENRLRNSASIHLDDSYIVSTIIGRGVKGEERERLKEAFLNQPDLIELKRNILKLKRECKTISQK